MIGQKFGFSVGKRFLKEFGRARKLTGKRGQNTDHAAEDGLYTPPRPPPEDASENALKDGLEAASADGLVDRFARPPGLSKQILIQASASPPRRQLRRAAPG